MKILSENNAFQNIQKCIEKKCKETHQIEDLLQFCIQTIFYDKINIPGIGIVPQYVINDSKTIIEKLSDYEIDVFGFIDISDNEKIKKEFTKNFLTELSIRIDDILNECKSFYGKDFVNLFPNLSQQAINITKISTKAINSGKIEDLSFDPDDPIFFNIVSNEKYMIEKVFDFAKNNTWNDYMTFYLVSQIKYLVNREFATSSGQIFSPSIIRGRKDIKNKIVLDKVEEIFVTAKDRFKITNTEKYIGKIKMPSIMTYLIDRSKGDVSDMLKITAELRSKFSCVREFINNYGKDSQSWTLGSVNQIANEVYNILEGKSNGRLTVTLENTYTHSIGVVFPVSSPVPDVPKIEKLIKLSICAQAFTEVIDCMVENEDNYYTEKLINNCGIN